VTGAGDGPVWLGIDLGTQGVRAVLADGSGAVVGSGSVPLRRDVRDGPRHEQDPAEWWTATCAATGAALAGLRGRPLGAVAVDSTSGTIVVQDPRGAAAGPGVMYDDTRGGPAPGRFRVAGAVPKIAALAAAGAIPPGHTVAHQADHMVGRLAGHPVATDTSHALKTGFDLIADRWPVEELAALGIDPAVLPRVVVPGTPIATVGPAGAAASGIPAGTVVVAGMTDGCAAQVATAALDPGRWCSALGTTLVLKGSTRTLLHDPSGVVYSHRNPDGGWLPGGASNVGAGILTRRLPGADLVALTAAAARLGVPPGATYPLVGRGERFPVADPRAVGFDVGVPDGAGPADVLNRVAHGVAYVERLAFEVLGELGADVSGPLTATGGATANAWWTQLRADVLGRPVAVPVTSGSAFGSAVIAAAPVGSLAATARSMVRIGRRHDPDPSRADELDQGYRRLVGQLRRRVGGRGTAPG
jgi:sugar (pentulose or hexulose) kinase